MRLMRLAIWAALAVVSAAAPIGALAHSGLVSSTPAAGAELATPPDEVTIVFEGELSPDGTGFTVTDPDGAVVGDGELDLTVADRNEVRGAVEVSEPGTYTVAWTSIAADGHQDAGDFVFTFAVEPDIEPPNTATTPGDGRLPSALGPLVLVVAVWIGLRRARRSRPMIQAHSIVVLLGMALVAILAGCIGGNAECAELPTRIELTLSANALTPADPAVCRDREVTLLVTSEVNGVLHIHGYDEEVPATTVAVGEVTPLTFTAARSGQFRIELHTDEQTQGVSVGIFTVHEP